MSVATPFDPALFDELPPQLAELMRKSLQRRRMVITFHVVVAVAVAAVLVAIDLVVVSPVVLVLLGFAALEHSGARRLQRVIRTVVHQPTKVTGARVGDHDPKKPGGRQSLDIRLADNTRARLTRVFGDDDILHAALHELVDVLPHLRRPATQRPV